MSEATEQAAPDLASEEAELIQQVQQLDAQERAIEEQLVQTKDAKQQAIGGLLTIRKLMGKDALGALVPEPPQPNRAQRRAKKTNGKAAA